MKISLKNWLLSATVLCGHRAASASEAVASPTAPAVPAAPFVDGKVFLNGVVRDAPPETTLADVYGCCTSAPLAADACPDGTADEHRRLLAPTRIGTMPQMSTEQALEALSSAVAAWDGGSGAWPQMSLADRIAAVQKFMSELKHKREDIVNVLMYEIGKNRADVSETNFHRPSIYLCTS